MKTPLLLAAAAAFGLAGAAHAATASPAKPVTPCFFSRDWMGWRAPDDHTLYLRVNVKDIYRVDLVGGSSSLLWPDSHLISEVRGSDSICNPIDLDLKVANDHIVEPLFVKALTKLTPEQIAAIPKKYLP